MPVYKTPIGDLLFIHVPKTGGSSVATYLRSQYETSLDGQLEVSHRGDGSAGHFHGVELRDLLERPPARALIIVRHPVSRVISEFKWKSRRAWRAYRRLMFSHWLRSNLAAAARNPWHGNNHWRPQVEFEAFDPKVFRYEDGLGPVFGWLHEVAGTPIPEVPPHLKKSRAAQVHPSPRDLALIQEYYREDFNRYGYFADRSSPARKQL